MNDVVHRSSRGDLFLLLLLLLLLLPGCFLEKKQIKMEFVNEPFLELQLNPIAARLSRVTNLASLHAGIDRIRLESNRISFISVFQSSQLIAAG